MSNQEPAAARSFAHRWLLLIPFLWQVGMVPFVNDVAWRPLSLPFPMVWQMVGIVITSILIAIVFKIDQAQEGPEPEDVAARPSGGDLH
ncbi:hypothetical protein ACFB49_46070 [Sphingomonas sp. DBB INV C78]|uniref:DUF3311 domain-containing protein n=1 Tax=Sphingomonas sp. DBB INV C78 TaxID=3349434 RepID=UPI0036D20CDE